MFLQPLDLTTALRPSLLSDETLLLVQDSVGLYEGKYKVSNFQNGHAYLTTHRACYVDDEEPRKNSVAVELKNVDKTEFYAGFLKSSAKVTLFLRDVKPPTFQSRVSAQVNGQSPPRSSTSSPSQQGGSTWHIPSTTPLRKATWVCVICSFSNPVPPGFDPKSANAKTPLPPCQACGIKPAFPHVLKAAIAAASGRRSSPAPISNPVQPEPENESQDRETRDGASHSNPNNSFVASKFQSRFQCPRCTFLNHPSLLSCELCGASLVSAESQVPISTPLRAESPGPSLDSTNATLSTSEQPSIKFSFRGGGEKIFYERLKGAMTQRKWLLQSAPPIPSPITNSSTANRDDVNNADNPSATRSAGITGLELRGLALRQKNEAVLSTAFSDLSALMASAKEIMALAESFSAQSPNSPSASTLIAESSLALDNTSNTTTRAISGSNNSLYLSEMARNLAEYLTDDSKNVLQKSGGIMPLVDLWSVYNRARGGVDLVSPEEFVQAARLWEKLRLPVRLREFRNGLLVVQETGRTEGRTVGELLGYMREMEIPSPVKRVSMATIANAPKDGDEAAAAAGSEIFGRGVTAQEVAQRFGWSVGVAGEELAVAEENDVLVRDEQGVGGVTFWENWIVELNDDV